MVVVEAVGEEEWERDKQEPIVDRNSCDVSKWENWKELLIIFISLKRSRCLRCD